MLAPLIALIPIALSPCTPQLEEEVRYTIGQHPQQVAMGDLDGDGFPDAVVGHFVNGTVSVLLSDGAGAFLPPVSHQTGLGGGVEVEDLNHDGRLDIIAANVLDDDVSILLADGDGGYLPQTRFNAGDGPATIGVSDLNQDTHLDLAISAGLDDTLRVFLGDGAGGFTPQAPITVDDIRHVVAGDFNGDSIPDLASARSGVGLVDVLLGIGDGTFSAPTSFPGTFGNSYLAMGDLDGDGDLDLVAVPRVVSVPPTDASVAVLLGDGSGAFAPPALHTIGQRPNECVITDINADGAPDIVASNIDTNELSILLGNADGTFQPQIRVSAGEGPASIAAADLMGDGIDDLVFINANQDRVSIMLNTCPALGCNAADLAEPFGTLDFSDVIAFLGAFGSGGAAADLAEPFGTLDFSDVIAFLGAFGAGCP